MSRVARGVVAAFRRGSHLQPSRLPVFSETRRFLGRLRPSTDWSLQPLFRRASAARCPMPRSGPLHHYPWRRDPSRAIIVRRVYRREAEAADRVATMAMELLQLEKVAGASLANTERIQLLNRQIDAIFERLIFEGAQFSSGERQRIVSEVASGCETVLQKLPDRFVQCQDPKRLEVVARIFLYERHLAEWVISFEGGQLGVMEHPFATRLQGLCQAAADAWIAATRRISSSHP